MALPRIVLRSSVDLAPPTPAADSQPEPADPQTAAANARINGGSYNGAHAAEIAESTMVAPSPFSNGPALAGQVEGPDRRAVAGAVLTVTDFGGRQVARAVSGADGRYQLGLPTGGTYLLICAAENHQPVASMVAVGAGEVHRDITLAGASLIEGRVLRHDGQPISGATLTLTDARGEVVGAAVTAPDGAYVLADLYPGDYTLTATAERTRPIARTVSVNDLGSHRFDMVLRSNATLAGTVRAVRSGLPVTDASVTLQRGRHHDDR
jgi:hypothetical protein